MQRNRRVVFCAAELLPGRRASRERPLHADRAPRRSVDAASTRCPDAALGSCPVVVCRPGTAYGPHNHPVSPLRCDRPVKKACDAGSCWGLR